MAHGLESLEWKEYWIDFRVLVSKLEAVGACSLEKL